MLVICYSYYIYIYICTYILYILYTIYIYTFIVTRSLSIHILCIDYIYTQYICYTYYTYYKYYSYIYMCCSYAIVTLEILYTKDSDT